MSTAATPFMMPKPVASKVARLRWLVRCYVWLEGAAVLAILLGVAFWLGLALDWLLEPRPATRVVLWFAVGLAAAVVAFNLLRRALAPLAADSLALLVERRHPELSEGLITTVQAAGSTGAGQFHRQLIDATALQTAGQMRRVSLPRVLRWRRLAWRCTAAVGVIGSIALLAAAAPETYAFWLKRMKLDAAPWPRLVQLSVMGFPMQDGQRVEYVARDDQFELSVLASIEGRHEAPDAVEVRWRRPEDGGRGGGAMRRIGEALPGRDSAQQYRFTFKVAADMEFVVVGGDDRVEGLVLRAVDRPTITQLAIDGVFPDYLQMPPRTLIASGRVELPEGARGVIRAAANKPLQEVVVQDADEQATLDAAVSADDSRQFEFPLEPVNADRRLAIRMLDWQGVENREPYRVLISVKPDEPPDVSIRLRGIGTAITADAALPFEGRLSDDYALKDAWFEYRVNDSPTRRRPLLESAAGLRRLQVLETFDLADASADTQRPLVELAPGDRLSLSLQCADAYNLTEQPHVGSSQQFLLDVVTPSELRAILEKRELGLRQRFEAVLEKMGATRDLLDRIDIAAHDPEDANPAASAAQEENADDADAAGQRRRQRDQARISGIRQNATQLGYESTGLADGFDDIVAEMVNNRVDTVELKQRLSGGIADPLRRVGGELLPRWEQTLTTLQGTFDQQGDEGTKLLAIAKSEADEVLKEMNAILDRMLELENYNELVELLRAILEQQQQLGEDTKQQRRANLRSLLED